MRNEKGDAETVLIALLIILVIVPMWLMKESDEVKIAKIEAETRVAEAEVQMSPEQLRAKYHGITFTAK